MGSPFLGETFSYETGKYYDKQPYTDIKGRLVKSVFDICEVFFFKKTMVESKIRQGVCV